MSDENAVIRFLEAHERALLREPRTFLGVRDFATWDVGGSYIVRFAPNREGDGQLQREAAALRVLRRRVTLAVPSIEAMARQENGHLAVGYPKLPGPSGEEVRPHRDAVDDVVHQVAEFLAQLHAIDPADVGTRLPVHDSDYEGRMEQLEPYAAVVGSDAPHLLNTEIRRYLAGRVDLPNPTSERRLCHTDLKGEHILVERTGARITGVIDWADIAIDDPAVDFGSLAIWLGPKFVRDVAASAGAPEGVVERGLFRIRSFLLTGLGKRLRNENSWPLPLVETQIRWAFADA